MSRRAPVELWLARIGWGALAVVPAPVGAAWEGGAGRAAVVVAWAGWFVALVALLAPRPAGLAVLRLMAPAAAVLTATAAVRTADGTWGPVSVALAVAVAVPVWGARVGDAMVDGASYGDERRWLLRTPGALVVGPLAVAVGVAAASVPVALTVAERRAWAGAAVGAAAVAVTVLVGRGLLSLARRWVVLVPAGLVVHDAWAFSDPVLFRREDLEAVSVVVPDPGDGSCHDARLGARGPALRLRLRAPQHLLVVRGRTDIDTVRATCVLVAPVRPGALVAEASRRRLPVEGTEPVVDLPRRRRRDTR